MPVVDPAASTSLDEGERTIDASGGDCLRACEGLAKITHARITLCAPRTSACDDAEKREDTATRKIAAFCDPCPPPTP